MDQTTPSQSSITDEDVRPAPGFWDWFFPLFFMGLSIWSAFISYRREGDVMSDQQTTIIAVQFLMVMGRPNKQRKTMAFIFAMYWLVLGSVGFLVSS